MSYGIRTTALAVAASLVPVALIGQEPDPVEIDGVVVTATPVPIERSALGASVTILDGDDLRRRGVLRVADALRAVPGVVVARNGSFGAVTSVFFRGAESDHLQVLVDGVQVNQPGGAFDFASLTVDDIERIEVVRGPGSALYGSDAVAGVVQVITRRGGGRPEATATVRGGSYGRLDGSVSVSGSGTGVSYGLTLSRLSTDGLLDFNNAHDQTVATGQARIQIDARTEARISARMSDRTYGYPTDGSGAVVDRNQQSFGDESTVALEVRRGLTAAVALRGLVTLADVESGTDDAPDSPADTLGFFGYQSLDAMRRAAFDLRADAQVGEGTVLSVGGEFEQQRVRSFSESQSAFGPSAGRSEYERDNRAGYAHLVAGRGAVSTNIGARLESNDQYGRFATWQVGLSWTLDDATRIRGAAGSGVKEPTFFEAWATGFTRGNPDLDPERSRSFEVGVERSLGSVASLSVTAFRTDLRDLIQYTGTPPQPEAPNYFNVAEARTSGVEASVQGDAGPLGWGVDWTLLDTEVLDSGYAEGPAATFVEGEALLRRPGNQLRLAADWTATDAVAVDAAVRRVGERSDRDFATFPATPVTLDAYTVVELGAEIRLHERAVVTVRGENLFDEAYQEVFGYAAPGRAVYLGGRFSIGR